MKYSLVIINPNLIIKCYSIDLLIKFVIDCQNDEMIEIIISSLLNLIDHLYFYQNENNKKNSFNQCLHYENHRIYQSIINSINVNSLNKMKRKIQFFFFS